MENNDFAVFYKKLYSMVFRRCLKFLRNHSDAEDATSEVFVKLLERKGIIDVESSHYHINRLPAEYYINKMITNKIINHERDKGNEVKKLFAFAISICTEKLKGKEEWEIWEMANSKETAEIIKRNEVLIIDDNLVQIENSIEQEENKKKLKRVLNEEDEINRNIFIMHHYKKMSTREIGKVVEFSKSKVAKRLIEIENRLRLKAREGKV